jgi:3'(2'), 5'-bisphosphate nucleotidase
MKNAFSKQYRRELELAARLAREAGHLVMGLRGSDLDVEMKAGDEPVTEADRQASAFIVQALAEAFPRDVIISEENADDLRRLEATRVWYIDPIDGTRDFIRGRDGFAVMIGLTEGHRPVAGVVYQPVHEHLFVGADAGAWLMVADQAPRRIQVSEIDDPARIRLVASRSNRTGAIDQVKSTLGIASELNIGSVGVKLCLIALGERDLYVNPSSHSKSWDTCAPEAILHAAGGRLTDVHGASLPYDLRDVRRSTGLVASNGHLHAMVIERLQPLFSP